LHPDHQHLVKDLIVSAIIKWIMLPTKPASISPANQKVTSIASRSGNTVPSKNDILPAFEPYD
jgi:hypothetical protein